MSLHNRLLKTNMNVPNSNTQHNLKELHINDKNIKLNTHEYLTCEILSFLLKMCKCSTIFTAQLSEVIIHNYFYVTKGKVREVQGVLNY